MSISNSRGQCLPCAPAFEGELIPWLVSERNAVPAQPLLQILLDQGDARGRRLVAAADVEPGGVLLSLPLTSCFVDDEVSPQASLTRQLRLYVYVCHPPHVWLLTGSFR